MPSKKSFPLKNLYKGNRQKFIYPLDIESTNHFAMFRASEELRYDQKEISLPKKEAQFTIVLPLPGQLSTGYTADYGTEDLGVLGIGAAEVASTAKEGLGGFVNNIASRFGSFTLDDARGALLNAGFGDLTQGASSLLGLTGAGNPVAGAMYGVGVARNPHQAVLFNSVGFRTHNFNYSFVPKNIAEQEQTREIIKAFKTAMLPDYALGNHFFKYPAKFDIDFMNKNKYLFDIKNSFLTSFNVDYHGQGGDFYHDINGVKAPVQINISMTFLEASITDRESVLDEGEIASSGVEQSPIPQLAKVGDAGP